MSPSKSINHKPLLRDLLELLGHDGVPQTYLHLQLASNHALPFIHQLWGEGVIVLLEEYASVKNPQR